MKLILVFLLLSATFIQGQVADTVTGNTLKNNIISKFNKKEFKGIYAMADTDFKANVTEEQFLSLLTSAASLGKISSSELINEDSSGLSYRLFFKQKSLLLNLTPKSTSIYSSFGLSFYKLPAIRTRKQFLSDNPLQSNLDSIVQEAVTAYMSNKNIAGLSVGVLNKGKMYAYNYGETKKGKAQLPTENTIYEIGSITKTFTGILLANAVLEGKVKLDDDIRKYLSGNYPNLELAGTPIRLVNLSNHTSGLPSQPKLPNTNTDPFGPSIHFTEKMLADILHNVTLDTIPGTKKEYSNFAVGLLGIILEKVYGMDYGQLVSKYILVPYGMKHTKIVLSANDYTNFSQGYDVEGNETRYWYNKIAEPAGAIRSTTHDMLLYMQAQISAKDNALSLSHRLTFGNTQDGTGLNWGVYTTKKGFLRWSHDGGTDGFTSLSLIYPELNYAIILLTNNGDHEDQSFFDIATKIYLYMSK